MACPLIFDGFSYNELRQSGNFNTDQDGAAQLTTRIYLIEWSSAYAFARRLVGQYTNTGGGLQTYKLPHRDPDRQWLFAKTVAVEGLVVDGQDAITGAIAYKFARLTVTYEPRTNDQTDPNSPSLISFLTESKQASAQALSIPEDKLVWASGPKNGDVIGDDVTNIIRFPTTKLSIVVSFWFDAPTDTTFEDLSGSVNDANILILQTLYQRGKLRFDFGNRTRQFTSDGVEAWQVQLDFMYRREKWNKLFDPDQGQFEDYETASGDLIHAEEDFRRLFPFGLVI